MSLEAGMQYASSIPHMAQTTARKALELVHDDWEVSRLIREKHQFWNGKTAGQMTYAEIEAYVTQRATAGVRYVCRACVRPMLFVSLEEQYWCSCGYTTLDARCDLYSNLPEPIKKKYDVPLTPDEVRSVRAMAAVRYVHES